MFMGVLGKRRVRGRPRRRGKVRLPPALSLIAHPRGASRTAAPQFQLGLLEPQRNSLPTYPPDQIQRPEFEFQASGPGPEQATVTRWGPVPTRAARASTGTRANSFHVAS